MEANASFEREEVVYYAHAYGGKIIFLSKMGITHDGPAFQRWEVSPLHPGPLPLLAEETEKLFLQIAQT